VEAALFDLNGIAQKLSDIMLSRPASEGKK
jgi:hypothetical protein